ncbi:Siderophore iron transporter [Wickerhamomyces ciferrii]|uniref:Siderophore iron transporter n=1 Tax=Wickerhamomyces ciferrii (strain ATCC 14091 / BCRC 22168 / CBS 111 / JCM 3599 / NBRC 0793 / NRRL Y-1031 F-60-10) TaxID=1206466 RepID=K0L0R5_WICCF|nr:Siderophore iron transporter [Wickerhamomyces ciferrii]CCH47159.1 Siderophore iron transporter [Wickerhamomyces ciferrii]
MATKGYTPNIVNEVSSTEQQFDEEKSTGLQSSNQPLDQEPLDSYAGTKSIVLKQSEILAQQYDSIPYRLLLLFCAFLIGYGYGLDANIRYVFTGYAASSYSQHSLIATVGVINAVVGAASQMAYARLSDVFGRLQILILSIVFYVIGTIIQSQATNIQNYCAGAVFYNLGYVGVLLIVFLILSDFSSLRWRLFYQFVPSLPFIINTWISGNVSAAVKPLEHWSWGIGMWAFIFPLSALPFVACILHMRWKARNTPEWLAVKQQKTFYQSHGLLSFTKELYWRTDITGILLLTVSLGCLLVPLTLAGGLTSKWQSGKIIGPLVLGFVLMPVFIVYESFAAKYPLLPYKLLKDRGVWAALAISFLFDFVYYMYADYLYTILIVGINQSVTSATRITSIATFVSVVWSPLFALLVVFFRRLKGFILLGTSLWLVGLGLLYHFRGGESSKNGIIGGLVVIGLGTTMFSYPVTVSVQAVTSHDNMATVSALMYTMYRIGSAVGNAVSGAIWSNLLPKRLVKNMAQFNNATLASSAYVSPYTFIVEYPYGTPVRSAMIEAYKHIQRMETLVAIVFCALMIFIAFFLRDPELTNEQAHNDLDEGEMTYKKSNDPLADFVKRWKK